MNILYIDDDAANRAVVRSMLELGGVAIDEAADARTGLHMTEAGNYTLILMDLRMPELSGLTAIRLLRARAAPLGQIPIIVVTADLTSNSRQLCQDAGASLFLAKPVVMTQLFDAIGSVVATSGTALIA